MARYTSTSRSRTLLAPFGEIKFVMWNYETQSPEEIEYLDAYIAERVKRGQVVDISKQVIPEKEEPAILPEVPDEAIDAIKHKKKRN